ncbi:TetR/AcrR family transcriptional regulator [Streptomyces sp. NPDC093589]|uniref:TetR/AcrR family transcriptional regulator n=1 Tax=Streptomyces sp. NPDC093589 TaxID=3366043 RepID=UPI0037FE0BDB
MKLTADRIIDAGMAVFAQAGYHGLSMRRVAEQLDAHAGSLYYHVPNKAALLQLMADRVARQAYDAGSAALAALPGRADWQKSVEAQAVTLRQSIRQHPGGAVMFADSPKVLSTGALSLMERLLQTLSDAGVPDKQAGIAADTLFSHITGFVQQEQGESTAPALSTEDITELHERFPRTVAAAAAHDQNEKFVRSVQLLCAGIRTLIEPTTHP